MTAAYDRSYHEEIHSGSQRSSDIVVPLFWRYAQPTSVLDIGCGSGAWLASFAHQGVQDIRGVDGPYVDPKGLVIPADKFTPHDLRTPLDLGRRFDLAISVEVAEHLPAGSADTIVDTLVRHAPLVLFSAGLPFQGGVGHINEQWAPYWVRRFAQRGFDVVDPLRPLIWEDSRVAVWYQQNLLVFVDRSQWARFPALQEEAARTRPHMLAVVHPRQLARVADPRTLTVRQAFEKVGSVLLTRMRGPRKVPEELPDQPAGGEGPRPPSTSP